MRPAVIYSALVLLYASLPSDAFAQTRSLSNSEQQVIQMSYGRRLRDPGSAQYEWPRFPSNAKLGSNTETGFCFRVNAKNAYGGYAGFKLIFGTVRLSAGRVLAFDYIAGQNDDSAELVKTTADLCRAFNVMP
jgi:hypothetical protein